MSHDMSEAGWSPQGPVIELSDQASLDLLASKNFGHLALSNEGRPDIFPVNYYCDKKTILFRTASGSKLHELTENMHVAFEVDVKTPDDVWSVVVRGLATVLDDASQVSAQALKTLPDWVPVESFVYILIEPESIRGRLFERRLAIGHS
ncbi:pyridoxamine 5'-phosphate oxidase family protein [Salinibacterium sp. NG253]|uniref:pyridoxamine 5'-phosphate oxidase family protein n=1 Tax=Salinibacterium sp. NG253 TaxID=2792039 RepID=UPI0018CCDA22|nr:pyridoxamine 5'-phosphate oxidase family protein [Salinibacterium sp. NG253]MBH0115379.1 pyridoxamine 5'-phosphate oxidase family protein [Salinibacterium sp. NG253]